MRPASLQVHRPLWCGVCRRKYCTAPPPCEHKLVETGKCFGPVYVCSKCGWERW